LKKICLYILGIVVSAIVFFISALFYAVECQWGCDFAANPTTYAYILIWLSLVLSVYLLIKLIMLIREKIKHAKNT